MLEGYSRRERLPGIPSRGQGESQTVWGQGHLRVPTPANGPRCLPCATSRPQPGTNLSAAPTCGNQSSRSAGTHDVQLPPQPPAVCAPAGASTGRPQRTFPPPTNTASELRRPRPHWCPDSQHTPTSPVSCRRSHASCLHPRVSPVVCPATPDKLQSDSTSQLLWYPVAKPQFRQWGLTPFQVHPSSQS